jgi:hypothetical protein
MQKLYVLPTQCIYVLCGSENKQRSFPNTTLTGFYSRDGVCLLRGTDWMVTSKSGQLPFKGFNTMRWTKSKDFIVPNATRHRRGFQKLQSKTNKRKDNVCFPLFSQSQLNESPTYVKSPITSAALHVLTVPCHRTTCLYFLTTDLYLLSAFPWISPYISTAPKALRYNLRERRGRSSVTDRSE